jgi:mono/diheme cytochrome c family protein
MKLPRAILFVVGLAFLLAAAVLIGQPSSGLVTTTPVYVPDLTHENDPMPDGVLSWNSIMMSTNLPADAAQAHFLFAFTNIAVQINKILVTNVTAITYLAPNNSVASPRQKQPFKTWSTSSINITWVTNSVTPTQIAVVDVHPSCGCTTAKLPALPWVIPPGGSGEIPITVNIGGKTGTFFKSVQVKTDKGMKQLLLQITVAQPVQPTMNDAERARDIAAAKIDRQAVFHNDCATCHVKNGDGKYGKALFDADCAICHEAEHRASFVADLNNLKVPTNIDFWRTWISHGKPGTFMPAWAESDSGPLNEMQIESLSLYLNQRFPSKVPAPPQ